MTNKTQIRTRFAPSPTGFQHIGGLRTAFYAALVANNAKLNGLDGSFILRIEDTDQERRVEGAVRFLFDELAWLGLVPDEAPSKKELEKYGETWESMPDIGGEYGPYIQSQRLSRYKEVAEMLIASGHAYRCDCTPEMLERERNEQMARKEMPGYSGYCRTRDVSPDSVHVVRFKLPTKISVTLDDLVKGTVHWDSIPMKDPILLKTDKFATYHLAALCDDMDMKITHVMRADEWLPSAPLHIMIYDALGWKKPKFAHLPNVLGNDGKKLSKRHGAVSSNKLREDGYLAEAVLNYVTLVGWSAGEGEEQEIFSREELIKRFSIDRINNASAVFDYNKLLWMNGVYIRNLADEDFIKRSLSFMNTEYLEDQKRDKLYFGAKYKSIEEDPAYVAFKKIAPLVKERSKTLKEVYPMVDFLFVKNITPDWTTAHAKGITEEQAKLIVEKTKEKISAIDEANFKHDILSATLKPIAEEIGIKAGNLMLGLRVAILGKVATPPLFESIEALGKKRVMEILETKHF